MPPLKRVDSTVTLGMHTLIKLNSITPVFPLKRFGEGEQ